MISEKLSDSRIELSKACALNNRRVCYYIIDDLLPADVFATVSANLPGTEGMLRRAHGSERKYVSADVKIFSPTIHDLVMAFSSPAVAAAAGSATGLGPLSPDADLYNGGITVMGDGDFMYPHLDNSHDRHGKLSRVFVLIFYLQADAAGGGRLGLWNASGDTPFAWVEASANRLVILEVSDRAWHSVEPIRSAVPRISVTTYLYDPIPKGRLPRLTRYRYPGPSKFRRLIPWLDFWLRSLALRLGLRRFRPFVHHRASRDAPRD